MRNFHIPLFPGGLYHLLNRANGDETLFREPTNFSYFLKKYQHHISPIAETLAWCLLPNHFHVLVRIKNVNTIEASFAQRKERPVQPTESLSAFIMAQFANWQNAYAKAYNKMYNRKGSVFMNYLRRVEIDKDTQLGNTVFYIHKNPVHHGFAHRVEDWYWSSYREYATGGMEIVDSREVLEWFGSKEAFIAFHQQPIFRK